MTALTKIYLAFAAAIVLALGAWRWTAYEQAIGARDARIASLVTRSAELIDKIGADSVRLAKRDTVRLWRTITEVDTVLQRIIESSIQRRVDTVTVERKVLVTADSVIRACRLTVQDCATLANSQASRIKVLDSLVRNLKQVPQGWLARWSERALWGGTGLGIGYLAGKR